MASSPLATRMRNRASASGILRPGKALPATAPVTTAAGRQRGVSCAECCSADPGRRVVPRRPLLSTGALKLSKDDVAAVLLLLRLTERRSRFGSRASGLRSWLRPTSAPSGGWSSPAPPTTLLLLRPERNCGAALLLRDHRTASHLAFPLSARIWASDVAPGAARALVPTSRKQGAAGRGRTTSTSSRSSRDTG